ncbi:retrovirus-related pol polyprotein from transposon TNT 1-94 [Tanacetum coccineum]
MTPTTPSSRLVPNPPPSASFVPPSRHEWDLVFQPVFDEFFSPLASVASPVPVKEAPTFVESTSSPSSTTVDQDAPSPKTISKESSSSDVISTTVHSDAPISKHLSKWTKDHPLQNIIDNPNHVYRLKKALYGLKQAPRAWYDLLSSFLLSQGFSKGTIDPTLFISRKGKDILLDEDTQGKAVDPTHYRGMVGTLMYLTSSRPDLVYVVCMCAQYQAWPTEKHLHAVKRIFRYLKGTVNRRSTSGSMQLLGDRLVSWSSKRQKSDAISSTEAEYIALSVCCAQVLWMRSQLTDYGLEFNKILIYYFIKKQVENGVIELYFFRTEYQLVDIFTKALCRERIEFLIDKLRMRSFTPATLKELADEAEE